MKALQVCRHHDLVADDAGQIGTALFAHWPTVMDHAGTLTQRPLPAIVLWPPDATTADEQMFGAK
jgi:hypothetical protein